MPTVLELKEKRANVWEQAKALQSKAEGEDRDLNAEESEQWDRMMADIDGLKVRADRQERAASIDVEMDSYQSRTGHDGAPGESGGDAREEQRKREAETYQRAFELFLITGKDGMTREQLQLLNRGRVTGEGMDARALTTIAGASGAFTIPDASMGPFMEAYEDVGGIQNARVTKLTTAQGNDIPYPTGDDTGNTGELVGENTDANEADPTFGAKVVRAYLFSSKMTKVPVTFIEDTAIDFPRWLMGDLAKRISKRENYYDTTGTGDSQPEGIVTVATSGVTAAETDDVEFDELVDLELSVLEQYRKRGEWMFNEAMLAILRKKADGVGRSLWSAGVTEGAPDRIWNHPYIINHDMSDPATGVKSILFGDFSHYLRRDVGGIQVRRLDERYAEAYQVAFLAFHRHDGKYLDAGDHPIKALTQA
jgi:HK97 family phage major capsid protein